LPWPKAVVSARFVSTATSSGLVEGSVSRKTARAVEYTLRHLGVAPEGALDLSSRGPTECQCEQAALASAVRAVCAAFGCVAPGGLVASIVAAVDGSAYGVDVDQPALRAWRSDQSIEVFRGSFPHLYIHGFDRGPEEPAGRRQPTAEYSAKEVAEFGVLRAALRRAVATLDGRLLGCV